MPTLTELMDELPTIEASVLQAMIDERPALVHERSQMGNTLLHEACWHKRHDLARVLIAAGADVNARGDLGRTPLHCAVNDAAADRMVPVIRALVEAHAVTELEDKLGFTVEETLLREVWGAPAPALDAMGIAAPSYLPSTRHFETGRAIDDVLRAFRDGRPLGDLELEGEVDERCVRDLQAILTQLAATSWVEPLRVWLRTTYKPAYANRFYAIYAAAAGTR